MLCSLGRSAGWARAGLALALVAAVISGFAVFTNSYGVRAFGDAAVYTTAKNLVAAVVLGALLLAAPRGPGPGFGRREGFTRPRNHAQWAGLGAVAVIGGSVPFILFFKGLAETSAADAAFIQKTLVVWVALLAVPLLRERVGPWHVAAIAALIWGQALLGGGVHALRVDSGTAMIFIATLMWAMETIIARRLLASLSALTVAAARMGAGVVILIGYTLATTSWSRLAAVGWHQWSWAIATGLILAAYVATWFAALARAGAIDVTALLVPAAIITALLQAGVQGKALVPQWAGLALVAAGAAAVALAAAANPRWPRPVDTRPAAVRYVRIPAERTGVCGPADHAALRDYGMAGVTGPGLLQLARAFTGAWPYLQLIAAASHIPDPLDAQVVEAYWVGNSLLGNVRRDGAGPAAPAHLGRPLARPRPAATAPGHARLLPAAVTRRLGEPALGLRMRPPDPSTAPDTTPPHHPPHAAGRGRRNSTCLIRGDCDDRAVGVVQHRVRDTGRTGQRPSVPGVPAEHYQVGAGRQVRQHPPRVTVYHVVAGRDLGVLMVPVVQQFLEFGARLCIGRAPVW